MERNAESRLLFFRWISHLVGAFLLCLAAPLILLVVLPSPVNPKEYPPLTPPAAFVGPLSLNNDLAFSEKIYENQLHGPESLVIDGDDMYTGTRDGWVRHIYNGEVRNIVRFGKEPCGGYENENTCGRPLGMRMGRDGRLIVCDAYHGLFVVDVTSGHYEALYKSSTPINGKASKMLNDLDVDELGNIYFTDSSTEYHRNQFFHILMEGDASGRLLMYDPMTKTTKQLGENLMFPNGVQVTPDQSGVLIAELSRARILKYSFQEKAFSIWADGLPGFPDNIRYDSTTHTYWVAISTPRFQDKFSPLEYLATRPWLRAIIAKVVTVSNIHSIKSYTKIFGAAEPQAMAVEFDNDGVIISSLQEAKGEVVPAISEIHLHNGVFYMGSYYSSYIARLDWKNVIKA